jgi:hypothetical protein
MKKPTAASLRIAVPVLLGCLLLSQWLGSLAWRKKVGALLTWANATSEAQAGALLKAPYSPDDVYYVAPRANDATGEVVLVYNSNRFRWLSLVFPEPSYDSLGISVRLTDGRLEVHAHYGSD